jgi:hypothetical protein
MRDKSTRTRGDMLVGHGAECDGLGRSWELSQAITGEPPPPEKAQQIVRKD